MKIHKIASVMIAVIALLAATALIVWAVFYSSPVADVRSYAPPVAEEKPAPPKKYFSPLTGFEVKDEASTKRQVTGVIIENSPDARPQSGIRDAGVVYEAIAEGGITRFACLYQDARPGLLGPVRSLRPYFVEWQTPYDPAYAHVGGSAKALETVRSDGYKDGDQFFNPGAYYRSDDRFAPHNVYTTFDRLDELNKSKSYISSTFEGWPRKEAAPNAGPGASQIEVDISSPLYNSAYSYDKEKNYYVRSQAGEPHIDRESNQPITPNVVIVIKVEMSLGFEDGYREQIKTTGSGAAYIFQDGNVQEVTWVKDGPKDRLKFIVDSEEVKINAGQTWVTAVSASDGGATWK